MWLIAPEGFVSIVHKAPCQPDELLVRGRTRAHVAALFPDAEIRESDGTDYRFRAIVKRADVAEHLAALAYSINYGNFKNEVRDRPFHDALMKVWNALAVLQPFGVYGHHNDPRNRQRGMFADGRGR